MKTAYAGEWISYNGMGNKLQEYEPICSKCKKMGYQPKWFSIVSKVYVCKVCMPDPWEGFDDRRIR